MLPHFLLLASSPGYELYMPDTHWCEMVLPSALRCTKEGFPSVAFVIPGSSSSHPAWANRSLNRSFPVSSPMSRWFIALRGLHGTSGCRIEFHNRTARPLPLKKQRQHKPAASCLGRDAPRNLQWCYRYRRNAHTTQPTPCSGPATCALQTGRA